MHRLHTLLGQHPPGYALRRGEVSSAVLHFDFADVPVPNKAFKRVVRDLEFDVAELALMTFLMARSRGVPLVLLPVVLFARNPLPYLVCDRSRRPMGPRDLATARLAARSYTTTSAVWVRALLRDCFGVDVHTSSWITYEEGHVAGVTDPPNVLRDPSAGALPDLLLSGAVDAAIIDPVPDDGRIGGVVPEPASVYDDWCRRHEAVCVNHVVVMREPLARDRHLVTELYGAFRESRARAAMTAPQPACGFAAMRPSLRAAIDAAGAEGLLAAPLTVDDLVTDELAALT